MENRLSLALLFVFCLALSFLLSGMEAGVFEMSRLRIRQQRRMGDRQAEILHAFLEHPERFLWTILIGNTLSNFILMSLTVVGLFAWLGQQPVLFLLALIGVGLVFYSLVDLLPKMLFRQFPNRICLKLARPFRFVYLVLWPLIFVISKLSNAFLQITGGRTFTGHLFGNREELRQVMQESARVLTTQERSMINRVLDLQNLTVGSVTIPISRVVTVDATTPVSEVLRICREKRCTRLPVWQQFARQRRIVGLVSLKSLLYGEPVSPSSPVKEHMVPALYLDEGLRVREALTRMQRSGQRLAVVLAQDGHELGLVSLQDVLRVIFGDISL